MLSEKTSSFISSAMRDLGCAQESKWIIEEISAKKLDDTAAENLAAVVVARRRLGEPLAYIFGHWHFRNLKLAVGPGVLIPRPETEELVELALKVIDQFPSEQVRIADFGAGSGAIAYALATESKKPLEIFAIEKSAAAFSWLKQNLTVAGTKNKITLLNQDWRSSELSSLDLIISNPPYVIEAELPLLDPSVKNFEPMVALVPDEDRQDPFAAYDSIMRIAENILNPGGALICEFGPAQKAWAQHVSDRFAGWKTFKDLSGHDRLLYCFDFSEKSR